LELDFPPLVIYFCATLAMYVTSLNLSFLICKMASKSYLYRLSIKSIKGRIKWQISRKLLLKNK
jgi:hypothetical protein